MLSCFILSFCHKGILFDNQSIIVYYPYTIRFYFDYTSIRKYIMMVVKKTKINVILSYYIVF
jgi:hypothetical protein